MLLHAYSLKIVISITLAFASVRGASQSVGIFEGHSDIGKISHPGNSTYDPSSGEYLVSGSGANIWFGHDDLHFVWKKMPGDFILQARGKLIGKGVEEHRKFGWMVRSGLDSSSAMVAATVHGDGLTSLQYRKLPAKDVEEIKFCPQRSGYDPTGKAGQSIHHVRCPFWRCICNRIGSKCRFR